LGFVIDANFHMWFMLLLTGTAVYSFVRERLSLEMTSVALITVLLLYGQFFEITDPTGQNLLNPERMLSGFANPSLIAVLALLVMGQAMIHTNSLRFVTTLLMARDPKYAWVSVVSILIFVMVMSAFMNNTPLVIIAIPIMQALLHSTNAPASRIMMPLSFIAILGGMTTLVGSSTNLLVSSTMVELGHAPLKFFDFLVPGMMLASVGFVYVLLVLPRTLPNRRSIKEELVGDDTEFVAELDIAEDSPLVGAKCVDGSFDALPDMDVKLIQRGGHLILPPFEGRKVHSGDILIVAASRDTLGGLLTKYPGFLLSEEEKQIIQGGAVDGETEAPEPSGIEGAETRVLAKIMITPASRMIDMSIDHVSFHKRFGAIVLGIRRRARVVRRRLGRIRLEAGDVLLVAGKHSR